MDPTGELAHSILDLTLDGDDARSPTGKKNDAPLFLAADLGAAAPKWPSVPQSGSTVVGESGSEYQLISPLGPDVFANKCWRASCESLQKFVSVVFFPPLYSPHEVENEIENTRLVLRQSPLRSANVVPVLDVKQDDSPSTSFVVLEDNIPTRQLSSVLQCNAIALFLNEKFARILFRDMVSAVVHLHLCGCIHRRLRENSFVVADDATVKLVEFGCSSIPSADNDAHMNLFRPPEFDDPAETSFDQQTQAKADVFSLGVLLVIMATGGMAPLARAADGAAAPLARGDGPHPVEVPGDEFWNGVETQSGDAFSNELRGSADGAALVGMMLEPRPAQRCSIDDVLQSAWLGAAEASARTELAAAIKAHSMRWRTHALTRAVDVPRDPRGPDGQRHHPYWVRDCVGAHAHPAQVSGFQDPFMQGHYMEGGYEGDGPMMQYAQHPMDGFMPPKQMHQAPHGAGFMYQGGHGQYYPQEMYRPEYYPRPPAPAICKFALKGGMCQIPQCQFYHPPGSRAPASASFVAPPRPRPGPGYVCHNCGDTALSHFKADCPHPQRCRYTTHGGVCTRWVCPFFHPTGSHLPQSYPAAISMPTMRPHPGPGYVCHNCGDTSLSHFKVDCPHPQRCRYTTHGGVCTRQQCQFFHPPGTHMAAV